MNKKKFILSVILGIFIGIVIPLSMNNFQTNSGPKNVSSVEKNKELEILEEINKKLEILEEIKIIDAK